MIRLPYSLYLVGSCSSLLSVDQLRANVINTAGSINVRIVRFQAVAILKPSSLTIGLWSVHRLKLHAIAGISDFGLMLRVMLLQMYALSFANSCS